MAKAPTPPPHSRLPIDHPDYRYADSRNPYWARLHALSRPNPALGEESRANAYSDNDGEAFRGRWRSRFPANRFPELPSPKGRRGTPIAAAVRHSQLATQPKLHLEIGCNAGHVVVEWAARDPENAYIGLDWKHKVIYRAAEKGAHRALDNLIFIRAHAERVQYIFGPGELDRISIFCPDPWPKKSQWKNRYITADRLRIFATLLKPGGVLHIKTDHRGYFEWMEDTVKETAELWNVLQHTRDLHQGHPDPTRLEIPEVTLFERLFIRDGIPINAFQLERK